MLKFESKKLSLLDLLRTMSHKCWRKAEGGRYQVELKLLFQPAKTILSLLTTSLWLATTNTGIAQPSPVRIPAKPQVYSNSAPSARSKPDLLNSGKQISLNGQTLSAAWHQWDLEPKTGKVQTAINDAGLMQFVGVELLNTRNTAKQPIVWFSPSTSPLVLDSWHSGMYRYLDVTQLATVAGWQMLVDGDTLRITTPAARVKGIRQGKQKQGDRIVVDLDRPTPWQVTQQQPAAKPKTPDVQLLDDPNSKKLASPKLEWVVTTDATLDPAAKPDTPRSSSSNLELKAEPNLTTIHLSLPVGVSPRVSSLANPNRIVIDLRSDAMVERDILWSAGLRWRQQFVKLGSDRFPVVWLEINPRNVGVTLKPISTETNSLIGTAPILQTAQSNSAAAAINGGFFNRNNKLPLGAIRQDGRWLSSPILNRGAIALNDSGEIKIGHLSWRGNIITSSGQIPISSFNSGYVSSGIALYSSNWGSTYTPLIDNEVIVAIQNERVTAQLPGGVAGKIAFPIPPNGYLLAIRASNVANFLPVGTVVREESATIPADFARYPQILGAGPLLVKNGLFVLDGKAEGFSDAFIRQTAVRSAIGTTAAGNAIVATIHNRVGGSGATLAETAKIMQSLGCVDALNLDGGSSTSLYLGGQLVDRLPVTAARVHNGLGIFLQPLPSERFRPVKKATHTSK